MFPVLLWIAKAGWKVMCPTVALLFFFFFLVYSFINITTCRQPFWKQGSSLDHTAV